MTLKYPHIWLVGPPGHIYVWGALTSVLSPRIHPTSSETLKKAMFGPRLLHVNPRFLGRGRNESDNPVDHLWRERGALWHYPPTSTHVWPQPGLKTKECPGAPFLREGWRCQPRTFLALCVYWWFCKFIKRGNCHVFLRFSVERHIIKVKKMHLHSRYFIPDRELKELYDDSPQLIAILFLLFREGYIRNSHGSFPIEPTQFQWSPVYMVCQRSLGLCISRGRWRQ